MRMFLYECNDFYDDEDGMPVPCEKEFWASDDNLTCCPRCGNDSLNIAQMGLFIEKEAAEVLPRISEYGLDGESLCDHIRCALKKYDENNVDMGIKVCEDDCKVRLFYHDKHNSFGILNDFVTDLSYEQLIEICDYFNIGYEKE